MMQYLRAILFVLFAVLAFSFVGASTVKPEVTTEVSAWYLITLIITILIMLVGFLATDRLKATTKKLEETEATSKSLSKDLADARTDFLNATSALTNKVHLITYQITRDNEIHNEIRQMVKEVKKVQHHQRNWMIDHQRVHEECPDCPPVNKYYEKD